MRSDNVPNKKLTWCERNAVLIREINGHAMHEALAVGDRELARPHILGPARICGIGSTVSDDSHLAYLRLFLAQIFWKRVKFRDDARSNQIANGAVLHA